MKILVTGASSLLGRTVADTLISDDHSVTVMQRSASGVDCAEIRGDITDELTVHRAVEGQDAVVHLAALVSPTGRWKDFFDINVGGTRNLRAASVRADVGRFVHISTPAVASSGEVHFGEGALPADPTTTRTHYARSKALAEQEVLAPSADDILVTALRPHLVWGPGDEQLVARIVDRAASGRLRLIGSGAALVDSTYVDNAADAIAAAVTRTEAVDGRALVISNGEPRPVAELLQGLCLAAGVAMPTRSVPRWVAKAGGAAVEAIWAAGRVTADPPMTRFLAEQLSTAHWYDQTETHALLDWQPTVSLDDGLARLRDWYQAQGAG